MKANLKNILGLAALGMTLLATTVPTWAGRVSTDGVILGNNQSSRWASGNMVDARYSADTTQSIGCKTYTGAVSLTTCFATDSAGRSLTCVSAENKFLDMVQGMTDSSFIYFETDNGSGTGLCRHIMLYNSSEMLQ